MTATLSQVTAAGRAVEETGDVLVMSTSVLSSDLRARLEAWLGVRPEYVQLTALRRLGFPDLVRRLRAFAPARLYLPLEDQDAAAMRPILECVASFTRAARIEIVDPDLRFHRVERGRAVLRLLDLAAATADGELARRQAVREVRELARVDRTPLRAIRGRDVAYLNANLWFGVKAGGSVGHIAGVANALQRGGWGVRYMGAAQSPMLDAAIRTERLDVPHTFGMPPEVNCYRFNRSGFRQALAALRADRPAFLYQRMSVGNYFGVQLSRALDVPLVLEYNGSEVWAQRHWGRPMQYEALALAAEDVCLRHAHRIVTVSETLRDELEARGVEPERIVWYPNCIDPAVFDPARFDATDRRQLRARYDLRDDDLVVTFVGTFGRWHGVDVLAEVVRTFVDEHAAWLDRRRVRFLFVGDGMMMPRVRELIGGDAYARYVRLPGLVLQHEAPLHLAISDVLVSPHVRNPDGTRFFGSPTKLFEYMAMGRAIVASDLDQIGDVLRPGVRAGSASEASAQSARPLAILCEPGDRAQLAAGIRDAVEHPALRDALGAAARAEALSKYLWEHHVRAILERLPVADEAGAGGR